MLLPCAYFLLWPPLIGRTLSSNTPLLCRVRPPVFALKQCPLLMCLDASRSMAGMDSICASLFTTTVFGQSCRVNALYDHLW